jgi:glycosyltransferase involved in cell wall biosynthesis
VSGSVGYLTKRFPRLSETFILDEILGLEAAGVPLRLYALADPREAVVQPDVRRVRSAVVYLHGTGGRLRALASAPAVVRAHVRFFVVSPRRYVRVLGRALRERPVLATAKHFDEAIRLAWHARRDDLRHVHAAFAHSPAAVARLLNLLTGIPYSFSAHAKDLYLSEPDSIARRVAGAEFVLVCSDAAAGDLRRMAGPNAARVRLAPHGVDTARFRPAAGHRSQEWMAGDAAEAPLRLLAVGRLVEKKGYPVLIDALPRARAAGHSIELDIVGGGPLLAELRSQAASLGLADAVSFHGATTHEEVAAAYGRADVFVQASVVLADGDRDGTPNSLLEAMASGLPVVATRVGGIPEVVVHGHSGLLAHPGDPDAFGDLIARLASDPDLRHRLGRQGRGRAVERYDRATMIRSIAPLFGAPLAIPTPGAPALSAAPSAMPAATSWADLASVPAVEAS